MHDVRQLDDLYNDSADSNVGVSDSGASLFLPWILDNLNVRVLIVDRDVDEVDKSMRKLGFHMGDMLRFMQKRIRNYDDNLRVLRVPFDKLDDISVMRKAFWHILPGEPFDEGRFEAMRNIKITVDIAEVMDRADKYKDEQSRLIKPVLWELQSCRG